MIKFFIERPIFASVCAIIIVLGGAVSIPTLPISQYPELAAPQVQVLSNYVGASAQTVESAVTTPLEQQINGAEGMRYMSSTIGADGTSQITATFDVGRNKDLVAVDIYLFRSASAELNDALDAIAAHDPGKAAGKP